MATTKTDKLYFDATFKKDDFILFGSETKGIREDVLLDNKEQCITIPMGSKGRSLNLGIATGIVTYEAVADKFGLRVANHQKVKWAWFNAIWEDGDFSNGLDRASAVYHPSLSEDRYPSRLADPNEHHQNLTVFYML